MDYVGHIGRIFLVKNGINVGEEIEINAEDQYGIYYELDGKQWIVPYDEICESLEAVSTVKPRRIMFLVD